MLFDLGFLFFFCFAALSKIYSNDRVWYFFYRIESTKQRRRRSTPTGFWKPTGQDRTIQDKGGKGDAIGIMKTLVYHASPNGVRSDWVMHEYHITCLPPDQVPISHVLVEIHCLTVLISFC